MQDLENPVMDGFVNFHLTTSRKPLAISIWIHRKPEEGKWAPSFWRLCKSLISVSRGSYINITGLTDTEHFADVWPLLGWILDLSWSWFERTSELNSLHSKS